jgi:D-alanyl-D-alanine-carboxypeptidase/D-alanyl-D-alanine-endopeptidase
MRAILMALLWIFVFLVGVMIGGAAVGFFWWAYATTVAEEAVQPLAELGISQTSLSPAQVDAYIRKLGDQYHDQPAACLVVGVAVGDERRYFAFGKLPSGVVPDERTIFELASVGKTFTGLLLADMVERGEVTLATDAAELLPPETKRTRIGGKRITLLDLATHSSGIPSLPGNMPMADPLNPYADYTVPEMYAGLRELELQFEPGRGYSYSNLGFGLLGHVLAERDETDYESLVIERICEPLGMVDTRMTLTAEQQTRIATPHDGNQPVKIWEDTTMAGAGSFLSTAEDTLKYVQAHWSGSDSPLSRTMSLATGKHRRTDRAGTAIGLGWHINSENALDIVWHNGGSGGSRSYVAMLPDRELAVVILANWAQADVDSLGRKTIYLLDLQNRARAVQ